MNNISEKMHNERTLVMIKPDGTQRKLIGKIMKKLELKGYKLVGCKLIKSTKE